MSHLGSLVSFVLLHHCYTKPLHQAEEVVHYVSCGPIVVSAVKYCMWRRPFTHLLEEREKALNKTPNHTTQHVVLGNISSKTYVCFLPLRFRIWIHDLLLFQFKQWYCYKWYNILTYTENSPFCVDTVGIWMIEMSIYFNISSSSALLRRKKTTCCLYSS